MNSIKGRDEIFAVSCSSFESTLLSMWNFLKHLLVSDSFDCVDSLCWDLHTEDSFGVFFFPLLSYLTNFLFGILSNLERAFEALMFKFWQPVVCSSDSQTVSLCDISVVKAGIKRCRSGTHCSNNHPIVSPSQNQLACQTHSHL